MSYNIYISTFGNKVKKVCGGVPIEVGACGRENFLYDLRDDTGDNISSENPYFGELTGLYWVWKNAYFGDDDVIGFCHFNKSLLIQPNRAENLLSSGYDFIVCRHQAIPAMGRREDYNVLLDILKNEYPSVYESFYAVYGDDGSSFRCNAKNTFITTGKEFEKYCSFLFEVLRKCRNIIGDVEERSIKRYAALFAERLFTAYLYAERKIFYEADVEYSEWYMTIAKMIINRLPFSGNSVILRKLRNKFKKSSYAAKTNK